MEGENMAIYALWYGGSSYRTFHEDHDVEVFASAREAREELYRREAFGYGQVRYADTPRNEEKVSFPAVQDSYLLLLEKAPGGLRLMEPYNPGVRSDPVEKWSLERYKEDGRPTGRVRVKKF